MNMDPFGSLTPTIDDGQTSGKEVLSVAGWTRVSRYSMRTGFLKDVIVVWGGKGSTGPKTQSSIDLSRMNFD
jgi:hypothetical protein